MRLINVDTRELHEFIGQDIPPYAILSHRWSDDEPTFKDFAKGRRRESKGYWKISRFCETVRNNDERKVNWAWVDTVCIDKKSSAELSESINSMWAYYRNSVRCYIYLSDVQAMDAINPTSHTSHGQDHIMEQIGESTWFTRGWTLQELLAPKRKTFLSSEWHEIGEICAMINVPGPVAVGPNTYRQSHDLTQFVSQITRIPLPVLQGHTSVEQICIAQRMSWASNRYTTRIEDEAYCLLGLFGINMPLIYGEGRQAFRRLQREIMRDSHDLSILAWQIPMVYNMFTLSRDVQKDLSVLAPNPSVFTGAAGIQKVTGRSRRARRVPDENREILQAPSAATPDSVTCSSDNPFSVTNIGLELYADLHVITMPNDVSLYLLPLNCGLRRETDSGISQNQSSIYLILCPLPCGHYRRVLCQYLALAEGVVEGRVTKRVTIHAKNYLPAVPGLQEIGDQDRYHKWLCENGELFLRRLGVEFFNADL